MKPIGLYIHVPFCASRCPYCDFFTMRPTDTLIEEYAAQLKTEWQTLRPKQICADSVYFGGGTPSLLPADTFQDLLETLRECFVITKDAEITVECNPSTPLETFLPAAAAAGVNRVSFGMQSAVEAERKALGRRAGKKRVEECLDLCLEQGLSNVTVDLMLGVPGQTLESLDTSLQFLLDRDVPHVSAYLLKLEEGTPFYKRAASLNLPEEDTVSAMYLHTVEVLNGAGVYQYEISNFAKPGFESRHNLKYWHCEEYLGFGPAAHSFYDGQRFYKTPSMEDFLKGKPPVEDGPGGTLEERLMLALRLTEGYTGVLPEKVQERASEKVLEPFLVLEGQTLRLTPEGFLLQNAILAKLLS